MIKNLAYVLYTSGGVAAAAATGYVVVERDNLFPPQTLLSSTEAVQQGDVAKPQVSLLQPKAEAEKPDDGLPVFGILRVEPDGSTVIGGTATPDSNVEILSNGKIIATTKADAGGDFAIVLDEPLAVGTHEMIIRATPEDGESVLSADAAIVNIPAQGQNEEVTVLVAKPGEASRILQKPVETAQASLEKAETVIAEAKAAQPVLIEAADVEGEKLFIAGKGEAGSHVNIYLGNKFLGVAKVGENGAFLFEGKALVAAGRHEVRADVVDLKSGTVMSRAEVNLVHEPEQVKQAFETAEADSGVAEEEKKEVVTGSSVIIRKGDNLWRLARRSYGEGIRFTTIFQANRDQVRDPNLIYPGQVLKVPESVKAEQDSNAG